MRMLHGNVADCYQDPNDGWRSFETPFEQEQRCFQQFLRCALHNVQRVISLQ
ncbi:hypothetical protein [Halodesulfovibrio marinisediminis]|uniref:hypothetical protein n=1 Tax=Halodesulfovibrio marinisediminis TaxID=458711 RepID=UPI00158810D7|nr:hypothetical protein [Halodesulfovibrio marinisediminis]